MDFVEEEIQGIYYIFVGDSNDGMNCLGIMANIHNGLQEESPVTVRFYEALGGMPEKINLEKYLTAEPQHK